MNESYINIQPSTADVQIPPFLQPMQMRGRLQMLRFSYLKRVGTYSIIAYLIGLFGVTMLASRVDMVMSWYWWLFGIVEVVGFFILSHYLSKQWSRLRSITFEKKLFSLSLFIRAIAVLFLYWFFYTMKGDYYMFASADETEYIKIATYCASRLRDGHWGTFFQDMSAKVGWIDISDMGYPTWLSFIFYLTNDSVLMSRLINALIGAYTCVLMYRLASRNFGEVVGRMAAIFCMLMPNLIYYCGINLKEIEMLFLMILFLESADRLLRTKKPTVSTYILPILCALLLFTFRNVLGAAAVMSLALALLLSNYRALKMSRRWIVLISIVIVGTYFVGGKIASELESVWENRKTAQEMRLAERAERTNNDLLKKASTALFAPAIFTLPFPTMIESEGQETFRMLHGGLVIKNITSFFTIYAILLLIFEGGLLRYARWKEHILLLAMLLGYLFVLAFSAFAHAERFHVLAVPLEMVFTAYGITNIKRKHKFLFVIWCAIMVVAMLVWNWFKLKGRGLV